MALTLC